MEEVREGRKKPDSSWLKKLGPGLVTGARYVRLLKWLTLALFAYVGMGVSNLVAFFIMLTAAVSLHAQGVIDIGSSAQAASALRPVVGDWAFLLFCAGIVGTGFLAVPVLAGSAAYALSGTFGWKNSLEHPSAAAPHFYAVIAFSTLAGVALGFTPMNPIKALYWSAVVNGVAAVPAMVVQLL